MNNHLRGIFPVLQTPIDAQGQLDTVSLQSEVAFCIAAGAHGVVYPVLGSEFQFLSDRERQQMAGLVIQAAAGLVPVVVGVAGASAAIAVEHAAQAAQSGASALIALPPYISAGSPEEVLGYYQAISQAAPLPIFVQNSAPGLSPAMLLRLLREVENVRYIKEEMTPSAHHISAVVAEVGQDCWGVFGGAFGRWMLSELRRGASGFMPAAEVTDVYVQIWDTFQAGDEAAARHIFNRLLPLINLLLLLGLPVCKEVLVRRGVIRTAGMRTPGSLVLDADDHRELSIILDDLRPLFRVQGDEHEGH
jgi:dihydrodipicolinate synthase/N-acetylneuraminate lyase